MHYYFKILFIITCFFGSTILVNGQQIEPTDSTYSIFDAIMSSNDAVVIIQPDGLAQRLTPFAVIKTNYKDKRDKKLDPNIRYRVQVFSDNNRQSAKANAEYRKRIVEQRMPGVPGYVTYDAPYWRVRVGNYQTEAEAVAAMKQIKSNFPAFSNDVRVVKVRVNN